MHKSGDILQARYRIVRQLGQGGMGGVYLATHLGLDAPVAVKEMTLVASDAAEAEAIVRQFRQEAQILHQLQHPNLPRVHDYFEETGQYYLVMDYVTGRSLEQLLDVEMVTEAQLLEWTRELCSVLEYLHNYNPPIIFRDLKPSNIMLSTDGTIKLVDFGIAKSLDARTGRGTQTSVRGAGTPGFAAPEQYGSGTDVRTDIYALGATLYCMLSRRVPPDSVDLAAGAAVLEPITMLRPDVSPDLARLIERMMTVNRTHRPASMREVTAALAEVVPSFSEASVGGDTDRLPLASHGVETQPRASNANPLHGPTVLSPLAHAAMTAEIPHAPATAAVPVRREPPWGKLAAGGLGLLAVGGVGAWAFAHRPVDVLVDSFPPGARVSQDHHPLGDTPFTLKQPRGRQIRLHLERPGYEPADWLLTVGQDVPQYVLTPKKLTLGLSVLPSNAQVQVDDGGYRPLPPSLKITPGTHEVAVMAPNYETSKQYVTVSVGVDPSPMVFRLKPLAGDMQITIEPPKAHVVVNDRPWTAKFPVALTTPGDYTLQVTAPGFRDKTVHFHLVPGDMERSTVTLAPVRKIAVRPSPTPPPVSTGPGPAATITMAPPHPGGPGVADSLLVPGERVASLRLEDPPRTIIAMMHLRPDGESNGIDKFRGDGLEMGVRDGKIVFYGVWGKPPGLGDLHTREGISVGAPIGLVQQHFRAEGPPTAMRQGRVRLTYPRRGMTVIYDAATGRITSLVIQRVGLAPAPPPPHKPPPHQIPHRHSPPHKKKH